MGPVLDIIERKETTMEASTSKDHMTFVSMPKDTNMKPESKHGGKFDMGTSLTDQDVEIINGENEDGGGSVKLQSGDATASSSSFGDTFSDAGACEYESENEVMSGFRGDLFSAKRKRVTSHWRKFVHPIMWRCKWVELQLRRFQSMAIMYDKEIKKHNQEKQLKYKTVEFEGGCAKSVPFFHDSQRKKLMKRKIRKRREEWDPQVYMSQHNLFSYYASCRSSPHGPTMDDDQTNEGPSSPKNVDNGFRVPDELLSLEFRDDYSLEQILWKIEVSQSQVSQMKNKLNTVMAENSERILSAEDLNLHEFSNAFASPVKEPDHPTNKEGPSVAATIASQLIKLNTGDDLVKPTELIKDETTGFEGSHVQDATKPVEESPASRKRGTDGILIYNRRAKKPRTISGEVKIYPIENLQAPIQEKCHTPSVSVSEDSSQNEQLALKTRSVSNLIAPMSTKRRAARTRPKSGSSLWTHRTSG